MLKPRVLTSSGFFNHFRLPNRRDSFTGNLWAHWSCSPRSRDSQAICQDSTPSAVCALGFVSFPRELSAFSHNYVSVLWQRWSIFARWFMRNYSKPIWCEKTIFFFFFSSNRLPSLMLLSLRIVIEMCVYR